MDQSQGSSNPSTLKPLRILLLSSDEPHNNYLAKQLDDNFRVIARIIEPGEQQMMRRRKQGKYLDYLAWRYHAWRRHYFGLAEYRAGYFATDHQAPAGAPVAEVTSINSKITRQYLSEGATDIVIAISTSIISRRLLRSCPTPIINIHGGYLPFYKGNHCYFFALYNNDYSRVGSTIHYIDAGVDTGDIIAKFRPRAYNHDSAETLYCRGQKLAILGLIRLLKQYEQGVALPREPQNKTGTTYRVRSRLPTHDAWFYLKRLFKAKRPLPLDKTPKDQGTETDE